MLSKDDLDMLEELINNELESYLDSDYLLTSEYVIKLRDLLKRLGLKEICNYDEKYKNNKG